MGNWGILLFFRLTHSKVTLLASPRFILLLVFYIEFGFMAYGGSLILMDLSFGQPLLSYPRPVWLRLEDLS